MVMVEYNMLGGALPKCQVSMRLKDGVRSSLHHPLQSFSRLRYFSSSSCFIAFLIFELSILSETFFRTVSAISNNFKR